MNQPLKIQKVNIGSVENLKFANVGDYWGEETMAKIIDLLHEFQDLFPTWFLEMKGILGDLGGNEDSTQARRKTSTPEAV